MLGDCFDQSPWQTVPLDSLESAQKEKERAQKSAMKVRNQVGHKLIKNPYNIVNTVVQLTKNYYWTELTMQICLVYRQIWEIF